MQNDYDLEMIKAGVTIYPDDENDPDEFPIEFLLIEDGYLQIEMLDPDDSDCWMQLSVKDQIALRDMLLAIHPLEV